MSTFDDALEELVWMAFQAGVIEGRGRPIPSPANIYEDWRAYGPGAILAGGAKFSAEIRERDDELFRHDEIEVCTQHYRFVPCRHGSEAWPCRISSLGADVEKVRRYQSGYSAPVGDDV